MVFSIYKPSIRGYPLGNSHFETCRSEDQDAIASDEELELDSPFMDAGMDSLSSVALMSMVAKDIDPR